MPRIRKNPLSDTAVRDCLMEKLQVRIRAIIDASGLEVGPHISGIVAVLLTDGEAQERLLDMLRARSPARVLEIHSPCEAAAREFCRVYTKKTDAEIEEWT